MRNHKTKTKKTKYLGANERVVEERRFGVVTRKYVQRAKDEYSDFRIAFHKSVTVTKEMVFEVLEFFRSPKSPRQICNYMSGIMREGVVTISDRSVRTALFNLLKEKKIVKLYDGSYCIPEHKPVDMATWDEMKTPGAVNQSKKLKRILESGKPIKNKRIKI